MSKIFADRHTQEMYEAGKSKRFPSDIWRRAVRKLEYIDLAPRLEDLKVPPSNRLNELEKKRRVLDLGERPMEDLFSVHRR